MRQSETPPAVGGSSLLVIFVVLCLTIFAVLGLSSVQAEGRLSTASADAVYGYYAADSEAEEILAKNQAFAEEALRVIVNVGDFNELLGEECLLFIVEEVGAVVKLFHLRLDGLDDIGMCMTDILNCNSCCEVYILIAGVVPNACTFAASDGY